MNNTTHAGGADALAPDGYVLPFADPPPIIQRAVTRLMNAHLSLELGSSEIRAMAQLLLRVDKHDGQKQFWLKRANLAEMFQRCERTVTNWLNALERAGLILKTQGRRDWGHFHCAELQLTPYAVTMFGLDEPIVKKPRAAATQTSAPTGKEISSGYMETGFCIQSPKERHPLEPKLSTGQDAGGASTKSNLKPGDTVDQRRIPQDCWPLLDVGISVFGVYRLMKEARKAGKRLSDVVMARTEAISTAKNAFAMIQHLIKQPLDYAWIVKHQQDDAKRKTQASFKEAAKQESKKRWSDQWLVIPEPGVEDNQVATRLWVPSNAIPEVHVRTGDNWRFSHILTGRDLEAFWSNEGQWVRARPVQRDEAAMKAKKEAAQSRLRQLASALKEKAAFSAGAPRGGMTAS